MSTRIESLSSPVLPEVQELVLLETLKALLTAAIRSLSHGEPLGLSAVSRDIKTTADEVMAAALNLGRLSVDS